MSTRRAVATRLYRSLCGHMVTRELEIGDLDKIEAALAAVERETLERAAKFLECNPAEAAQLCAQTIRTLKTTIQDSQTNASSGDATKALQASKDYKAGAGCPESPSDVTRLNDEESRPREDEGEGTLANAHAPSPSSTQTVVELEALVARLGKQAAHYDVVLGQIRAAFADERMTEVAHLLIDTSTTPAATQEDPFHAGYAMLRRQLRELLDDYGEASNPGWDDADIVRGFRKLLMRVEATAATRPAYQAEELDVSKMSPQERAAWSCEARGCPGCTACEPKGDKP